MKRVDLVLKIQRILKAKRDRGKINEKSCVSWKIQNYEIAKENLVVEGEYTEEDKKEIIYEENQS